MAFNVKPFAELIKMTKEALDDALLPLRVRAAKARAETERIKLEEQLISQEARIHEACADKDINFIRVSNMIDEYELTERRLKQINELVANLFP